MEEKETMSTNDVPGANPKNADELAMGCWAEHEDGSLIFVEGTEGGRVIFSIFDVAEDPPVEYRDAMAEQAFKKQFSWDPKDPQSVKWTWHDKTPFPWDRIIQSGSSPGTRYASAEDQLSAAERVARSRNLRGDEIDPSDYAHLTPKERVARLVGKLQDAIGKLPL